MEKHEKSVGKGRRKSISNGKHKVRVTLRMEDVEKFVYEFKGKKYITIDIEEVWGLDRTHTCFAVTKSK